MSKRFFIFFFTLLVLLLLYGYHEGWDILIKHPDMDPKIAPYAREIESIKKQFEVDPEGANIRLENVMEEIPEDTRIKRQYNLGVKAAVTDLVFYGKVIDQYNRPVANAKVSYFIAGQFLASGAGRGFTLTDENGLFSISGEGAKVVIQDIAGNQIDYNNPTPEISPYLTNGENPDLMLRDWEQYTIENPYIFKAWRIDEYGNVKSGGDGTSLQPDGRVYTYDAFSKNRNSRWKDEETEGLLRVTCERAPMAHARDYQDWRITLTPVDGGIRATDDIYMNEAPVGGYTPSITIDQKLSSHDYQEAIINQRYYFTAHSGKYYGSLFVHYEPHFRNEQCVIRVSYKINLDGSRRLAVKEAAY